MRIKVFIKNTMATYFPELLQNYYIYKNRLTTSVNSYIKVESVTIESTNICNAKCTFCPHGTGELNRKKEIMQNKPFFHLIDICKKEDIRKISFGGIGEFLCDRDFLVKANYIVSSGLIFDSLTTNAMLLDSEMAHKLCKLGLRNLNISIDSLDKFQYERIRRNLKFEKVMENIFYFLEFNLNERKSNVCVTINLTLFEDTVTQKQRFIETFQKYLGHNFKIVFYPIHNWSGFEYSGRKRNSKKKLLRTKCDRIFDSDVQVRVDGSLSLCCLDFNNLYSLGKVTGSINEVWNSKKIKEIRKIHINGMWDKISICRNCSDIIINKPLLEVIADV